MFDNVIYIENVDKNLNVYSSCDVQDEKTLEAQMECQSPLCDILSTLPEKYLQYYFFDECDQDINSVFLLVAPEECVDLDYVFDQDDNEAASYFFQLQENGATLTSFNSTDCSGNALRIMDLEYGQCILSENDKEKYIMIERSSGSHLIVSLVLYAVLSLCV